MKFSYLAAAAALGLMLTACASQPDPETTDTAGSGMGDAMGGDMTGADNMSGGGADADAMNGGSGSDIDTANMGPEPGSAADFQATAENRVFFGFDRHDLTREARETLRSQAAWLRSYPSATILIAGNADERGTREYNLALGGRRADAARDYLVSQGVDPSRIRVVSYGKERPVCTASTEACWQLNRNATTTLRSAAAS